MNIKTASVLVAIMALGIEGCTDTLTEKKAEQLITDFRKYPTIEKGAIPVDAYIDMSRAKDEGELENELNLLQNKGLITYSLTRSTYVNNFRKTTNGAAVKVTLTDKGQQYAISDSSEILDRYDCAYIKGKAYCPAWFLLAYGERLGPNTNYIRKVAACAKKFDKITGMKLLDKKAVVEYTLIYTIEGYPFSNFGGCSVNNNKTEPHKAYLELYTDGWRVTADGPDFK